MGIDRATNLTQLLYDQYIHHNYLNVATEEAEIVDLTVLEDLHTELDQRQILINNLSQEISTTFENRQLDL